MPVFMGGSEQEFGVACHKIRVVNAKGEKLNYEDTNIVINALLVEYVYRISVKRGFKGSRENFGVLWNGSRAYPDCGHAEVTTGETTSLYQLVCYDAALSDVIELARVELEHDIQVGNCQGFAEAIDAFTDSHLHGSYVIPNKDASVVIFRTTQDRHGTANGYHENFLMPIANDALADTDSPFMTFLISGYYLWGTGALQLSANDEIFVVAPRLLRLDADVRFSAGMVGGPALIRFKQRTSNGCETVLENRLTEPTRSEVQSFVRFGSHALFARLFHLGELNNFPVLQGSGTDFAAIARDVTASLPLQLKNGNQKSSHELQKEAFKQCRAAIKRGADVKMDKGELDTLFDLWGTLLSDFECDPVLLRDRIDWVAKREILEHMKKRNVTDRNKFAMADLCYHDTNRERSIYEQLCARSMQRLTTDQDLRKAVEEPPPGRAAFRVQAIRDLGATAADWAHLLIANHDDSKGIGYVIPLEADDWTLPMRELATKAAELQNPIVTPPEQTDTYAIGV